MNLNFMLHILSHSFPGRYGNSDISSWEPKKQSDGGYNNNYCLCQCIYIPKEQSDGVLYNVIVYTLSDEVSDDCLGLCYNYFQTESTFLTVERKVSGKWVEVCNDACWETQ